MMLRLEGLIIAFFLFLAAVVYVTDVIDGREPFCIPDGDKCK